MTYPASQIERLLAKIGKAKIFVEDLTGTQDHYKVIVISDEFLNKPMIKRHQVVYQTLAEPMQGPIHALTIATYTEQEWQTRSGQAPQQIKF